MLSLKEIEQLVILFVKDMTKHNDITADTTFSSIDIDSLSFIQLLLMCEDELHIELPDDVLVQSHFTTLKSLVETLYDLYINGRDTS